MRMLMLALVLGASTPALAAVPGDKEVPAVAPQTPLEPVAAENIRYVGANGQFQTQPWAALTEPVKRSLLPNA